MTLEEYLGQVDVKKLGCLGWFAIHPAAKEQVDKHAILGTSPTLIHEWLVEEYEYPMSASSLKDYVLKLTREHKKAASRAA